MRKLNEMTKLSAYISMIIVMILSLASVVFADDISNNLDTSVDAVAEIMSLNVGGPTGATQLYLITRNGDGKNGCNLTGSTTLVVSVNSSNLSVATVSPSQITFDSCEDRHQLTITPISQGTATISLTQVSNSSQGTFNLDTATFIVNVAPPPNTPPTVTIEGVSGGQGYEIGSVPAATCQVTDAEDGNRSFAATLSGITGPLAGYGLGEQTASCGYTDAGGLTASASVTYSIVDTVAPTITLFSREPAANANGWNNSDVTVTWSCSDSGSGAVDATVSQTVSSEGAGQSATGTCADHAGNAASNTQAGINIDKTAPTITLFSREPAANASGWNNGDVTVTWSCSDSGSGAVDTTVSQTVSSEGAGQSATGTCADYAGNTASDTQTGINIDKTAPTITLFSREPAANASGWNNSDVTVTWSCSDSGSGAVDATVSQTVSSEGAGQSATGTCADYAGNTASNTQTGINIDKTAPTITDQGPAVGPGGMNGWYIGAVANTFNASDTLSGFEGQPNPYEIQVSTGAAEGDSVKVSSGPVTDLAGNTAAAIDSAAFKIDLSDPTNVAFIGGPDAGASYYFGSVPAAPTCTAEDTVSGLAGCVVSGYSTAVGAHTLTATATDNAGRTATSSRAYSVLAWTLKGFYQPVDMNGVFNVVKGGSTVPLKFEVFAGPAELTSTAAIKSFVQTRVACDGSSPTDEIEVTTTGGTSLRYDSVAGQFIQNWQTPRLPGVCFRVTMTTQDGSSLVAFFKLK